MANISILEQDLTTAGSSSVTANVIYVPGYSIMGPLNEPVLCNTLAEFKKTFGAVPYTFKTVQGITGKKFATAGDYEQSYLYAAELVKAGLPVLFERVGTIDTKAFKDISLVEDYFESTPVTISKVSNRLFNITDKSEIIDESTRPTEPDESLDEDLREAEGSEENTSTSTYKYTFKVTDYRVAVDTPIIVTHTLEEDIQISNIELVVDEDGEQSVTFISDSDKLEEVLAEYDLEQPISYLISYEYVPDILANGELGISGKLTSIVKRAFLNSDVNWSVVTGINPEIDLTKNAVTFIDEFGVSHTTLLNKYSKNTTSKLNTLKVTAKFPGEYGRNISVKFTQKSGDGDDIYYDVFVNQVVGTTEVTESKTISFNEANTKYYKNIEFDLIDISGYVDYEAAKLNLIKIKDSFSEQEIYLDYTYTGADEFNIDAFYNKLAGTAKDVSILEKLADRDEYQIKFLTTGAYPTIDTPYSDIATTLLKVAANRCDCVALVDHLDPEDGKIADMFDRLKKTLSVKILGNKEREDAKKYGAMFTPWGKYQLNTIKGIASFPGSFGYLRCVASSFKTNASWLAVSGITRGQVPDLLSLNSKMTGALAEELQKREGISINPITNIKPYGYCIWGNRTLYNNIDDLVASSFLNIRMLECDIKKVVYKAAKKMTFELNSDTLWLNFKADIEPTLEQMISGNGLRGYKITKVTTSKKATIACTIRLYAIEAVEDWDINIELADGYTSIN